MFLRPLHTPERLQSLPKASPRGLESPHVGRRYTVAAIGLEVERQDEVQAQEQNKLLSKKKCVWRRKNIPNSIFLFSPK